MLLNNNDVKDVAELYNKFYCNELNQIEKQNNSMNLQALKSDIRKKRSSETNIKNYKEKIFYYFNDNKSDNTLNEDTALKLIFTENEIKCIDYLKYNLNKTTISNIIYDINFDSKNIEIQYQADISQQINSQVNSQVISEINTETSINYLRSYDFPFTHYFNRYKFKNFDFIKNIKNIEDYKKYTLQLDDILSFLPNIFINNYDSILYTFYQKSDNKSDLIFIYMHTVKKFILIPKYMIIYLYDDFVMYDINFKVINVHKIDLCDNDQEEILKNNIFVKILSNNYTREEFNDFSSNIKLKNNYYLYLLILYFRIIINKLDNILIINLFYLNQVFINQNLSLYFNFSRLEVNYDSLIRNNMRFQRDIQYTIKNDYLMQKICIFKHKANSEEDIIMQKKLGKMYEIGLEVESNINEAIKYYKLAALNGNLYSQMKIGKIYESGIKISKDYNEAIKFYKLASLNNSLIAQIKLARIYENGIYVPQNYNEAVKFYEFAQNSEEDEFIGSDIWIEITLKLAIMYKKGKVIKKNINKAIYYYKILKTYSDYREIDNREIDYILGNLYYKIGNIDLAIQYFYDVVNKNKNNNIKAMNKLGDIYNKNKLDFDRAIYYYQLAIEKGKDVKSMCCLADIYLTNSYFNIDQAIEYSEMAAKLDSECGLRYLSLCYYVRENIFDDTDWSYWISSHEFEYLKKAALKKYDLACKMLACLYIIKADDNNYKEANIYNQLVKEQNLILKQNGSTNLYKDDIEINIIQAAIFYKLSDNNKVEYCKLYEKEIDKKLKKPFEVFFSIYNHDEVYKKGIDKKLIERTVNIILANNGDRVSQGKMAEFYIENKEIDKAICMYKEASKDDIISFIKLGEIYENNIHIFKDGIDKAINYYELAVDKGDITILNKLLKLYDKQDQPYKISNHIKYYELASHNNDTYAQIQLGQYYLRNSRSEIEINKGIDYYKLAIKNGDSEASYLLGKYYGEYYRNIDESLKYYKLAAENGHINALKYLGYINLRKHNKEDIDMGIYYYKRAGENGDAEAYYILATFYQHSDVYRHSNKEEALKYYRLAAENGHIDALKYLGSVNINENPTIGICYYKRAGENSDAESYYILGQFYNNIDDTNNYNKEEALKYYRLAANMNHYSATLKLEKLSSYNTNSTNEEEEANMYD